MLWMLLPTRMNCKSSSRSRNRCVISAVCVSSRPAPPTASRARDKPASMSARESLKLLVTSCESFGRRFVVALGTDGGGGPPEHGSGRRDFFYLVTGRAGNSRDRHAAVLRRNALGSFAQQHANLLAMLVRMTRLTVSSGVFNPLPVQGMLDFQMTFETIDFVVGDVHLVHEYVVVDSFEIVLAIMTSGAAFARDVAVAADQIAVAVRAVDAAFISQVVAELHAPSQVKLAFRDLVAAGTRSQPLVEQPIFEMAQKTSGRRHRHVRALDNLAVATGAAQPFSAPQIRQMRPVVKRDSVKIDAAGEQSRVVTAQTTRV